MKNVSPDGHSISEQSRRLELNDPLKSLVVAMFVGIVILPSPMVAQTVSDLGAAQSFTILGGSGVTSTGATIINGDLGVSPGTSITGFPPGVVINGSIFNNVAPATTAHADTLTAFNMLAGLPSSAILTGVDLGGLTLAPGVYTFASTAGLTGVLTLDNTLDPTGAYVFQIGTGLTTATGSAVILLGGRQSQCLLAGGQFRHDRHGDPV